jgi:hypothetical protein
MKNTLNMVFTDEQLLTIYEANQEVTIVKKVGSGEKSVVWVTFKPFKSNTIVWETNYAVYCSNSKSQNGATINRLADTSASPQIAYEFNDGQITSAGNDPTVAKGQYKITNKFPYISANGLTFGLAQSVQVNGTAFPNKPINAVFVPSQHEAEFIPYETVQVYLHASTSDSMIVSDVQSKGLDVVYGGSVDVQSLTYNPTTGLFVN